MPRDPIAVRAQGRWRGILLGLGMDASYLTGRHGPCPVCGGKDRFRFDDKDGKGTFFCNSCGAGDGMQLAVSFTGKPFREAVKLVEAQLGTAPVDEPRPAISTEEQRASIRGLWEAGRPLEKGDPAETYLAGRGLSGIGIKSLRYVPECWHAEAREKMPALVAAMQDVDGRACTLHRTYLTPDGHKADVAPARKLMVGKVPAGACVRLGEPGETLGVAEGIETALAASALGGIPVWAALTSRFLEKWQPPETVKRVVIYMDNDASFEGQRAAYSLAHRLAREKRWEVEDKVPGRPGQDFNDIWLDVRRSAA